MSVFAPQAPSTPAATPNPTGNAPSPDQAANAPTPGGSTGPVNAPTPTDVSAEVDESSISDACDESWAVVLSHRLNCSAHVTEYRPALASGYLLRRRGTTDGDGAFSLNVNLVYTRRPSSLHEALLKETLGMYRGLATLARCKGTRNVQENTLPWHIATSLTGQELLSYVL